MQTLEENNPDILIAELLERLLSTVDADIAMWFAQGTLKGREIVRRVHSKSSDQLPIELEGLIGKPRLAGSAYDSGNKLIEQRRRHWSVREPAPQHMNAFASFRDDYIRKTIAELTTTKSASVYSSFYGPAEIGDQLRAIMYQGSRSLGLFGIYRRGRDAHFNENEKKALNELSGEFLVKMSAVEALSSREEPDDIEHVILGAKLEVKWTSARASGWLNTRRLEHLRERVKRKEQDFVLDGVATRVVAMKLPSHGQEYLLTLEPTASIMLSPLASLPHQTRRVANLVLSGMSMTEIASIECLSSAQTRRHIRALFNHFHVEDLISLATSLASVVGHV